MDIEKSVPRESGSAQSQSIGTLISTLTHGSGLQRSNLVGSRVGDLDSVVGCSVLVTGGCSVLVTGGCSVLVTGGCSVLATGGCSVLATD